MRPLFHWTCIGCDAYGVVALEGSDEEIMRRIHALFERHRASRPADLHIAVRAMPLHVVAIGERG